MAVTAAPRRRRARHASGGNDYDAFISYSHAVDGKLAPALQGSLHRFAKPWYRLRALRVFRDEASLSANPALWSSIQQALERSEFFILLASAEAARSHWVGREAAYWCEHKDREKLLIALTQGEIIWDEASQEFDWSRTTALPPTLRAQFGEEPRFIDFRWAQGPDQLSLRDPTFRDAVADIAAPLHGTPKDQLLGEDVRQHRRTVRLARAAITSLTILALATTSLAVIAERARNDAVAKQRLATSRFLAAQAAAKTDDRLDLAALLGVEALRSDASVDAKAALLTAVERAPSLLAFLQGRVLGAARPSVDAVAVSPDGKLVVSAGPGNTVSFWDLGSRRRLGPPVTAHQDRVTSVAFSPDGKSVVTGAEDSRIQVWDAASRQPSGPAFEMGELVDKVAFSPDGATVLAAGRNGTVAFFDLARRRPAGEPLRGPAGPSSKYVAVSPDGRLVASGRGDANGVVTLADPVTHQPTGAPIMTGGRTGAVAFSPDGSILATASDDDTILWNVSTRQRSGQPFIGHTREVTAVAFSPDGRRLVTGGDDATIRVWDLATRTMIGPALSGPFGGVTSVAFADADTLVSSSDNGSVIVWRIGSADGLGSALQGQSGTVTGVAFSPDGKTLASVSTDGSVVLWDAATRRPKGEPLTGLGKDVGSIAFSPDGATLAARSGDAVVLWDVAGHQRRGPPLTAKRPRTLAFSPDGALLAAASDKLVLLWDAHTGRPLEPLAGHTGLVDSLAFSPDGRILLSTSAADNTAIRWDVASRRPRGDPIVGAENGLVAGGIGAPAFSPDGAVLALANGDGTLTLFTPAGTRRLGEPQSGEGVSGLGTLLFSPDGGTLFDSTTRESRVWDVASGQQVGTIQAGIGALSPGGTTLASGGSDGRVLLWDARVSSWRARACQLANRNLTRLEWSQFMGIDGGYRPTCPALSAG